MSFRIRRWALAGAAVAAATALGAATLATADTPTDNAGAPFTVEDGAYPGAADILRDKGITLTGGDGRISLTDCASAHQIEVYTRTLHTDFRDRFCFSAPGGSGYLALSIPEVYAVQTTPDRALTASVTADGQTQTVDVPKGNLIGVGEGTKSGSAVLLELRITA
ncbi:hypothetical protein ACFC1R_35680 [Kitasatospora sp. NPDC056138]|uniref:hypothetical protein n=1 Tax=Kitasatospora sp. NPDC056138 TaxID=3345724 RepID=UPI0035D7AD31